MLSAGSDRAVGVGRRCLRWNERRPDRRGRRREIYDGGARLRSRNLFCGGDWLDRSLNLGRLNRHGFGSFHFLGSRLGGFLGRRGNFFDRLLGDHLLNRRGFFENRGLWSRSWFFHGFGSGLFRSRHRLLDRFDNWLLRRRNRLRGLDGGLGFPLLGRRFGSGFLRGHGAEMRMRVMEKFRRSTRNGISAT